jgi:hypothetical protein
MVKNIQCTCNTLCRVSQKSFGFYYIYFKTWKGIAKLVTLMVKGHLKKSWNSNAIHVSYCNNPSNMKHKNIFKIFD